MLLSVMLLLEHLLQNRIMDTLPMENVKGERINRMIFLDTTAPLRTDIDFINRSQPEHHFQDISSPFELISIPIVSPIDYKFYRLHV